jgi:hypothetical protein
MSDAANSIQPGRRNLASDSKSRVVHLVALLGISRLEDVEITVFGISQQYRAGLTSCRASTLLTEGLRIFCEPAAFDIRAYFGSGLSTRPCSRSCSVRQTAKTRRSP